MLLLPFTRVTPAWKPIATFLVPRVCWSAATPDRCVLAPRGVGQERTTADGGVPARIVAEERLDADGSIRPAASAIEERVRAAGGFEVSTGFKEQRLTATVELSRFGGHLSFEEGKRSLCPGHVNHIQLSPVIGSSNWCAAGRHPRSGW